MLRRLTLAVAILTLSTSNAQAQWDSWIDYSHQCYAGGLWTCASVQVYTRATAAGTYVEIQVRNLMSDNTVVNQWNIYEREYGLWGVDCCNNFPGFNTGPSPHGSIESIGPVWQSTLDMSNGSGEWDEYGNPRFNLYGYFDLFGGGGVIGCENNLPIPINSYTGLATGYYRTCPSRGYTGWWGWAFTIPNRVNADAIEIGWIGNHGYGTPPPANVSPEPVTMTLLATGLAGVGGAAWRRRKSKGELDG